MGKLWPEKFKPLAQVHNTKCLRWSWNSEPGLVPPRPLCFPGGSVVKNVPANAGDLGLIPGLERSPGGGTWQPTLLEPNAPGNKLTQKNSTDCGMQFITPAGPRQSFLFSQGPRPTFVKTLYTLSVHAQADILKFLKPSLENVKGRQNQVTAMIHNQKGQLVIHCNLHQSGP